MAESQREQGTRIWEQRLVFGSLEPHQLLFIICNAVWDGKLREIKKIKIFFLFVNRGKKTERSKVFIVQTVCLHLKVVMKAACLEQF